MLCWILLPKVGSFSSQHSMQWLISFSLDASPACPPNLRLLFAQCMSSALPNGREIRWHMVSQQYGRDGFSGPRAGPFDHCFFPEEQQDSAKAVRVFRAGSGKWRIEGNDFVQEIDSELPVFPENTPIPKMVIRRKRILPPVTIRGVQLSDGSFWPYVTLQVGDSTDGPWKEIGRSHQPGKRSSVTIPPTLMSAPLRVDFLPFLPFLHRNKLGRVVLPNGDAALFELKDLRG